MSRKVRVTNPSRITQRADGVLEAEIVLGPHGGVMSVHRFGTDGNCDRMRPQDAVLAAELVGVTGRPHCGDCASITTGLFGRDGVAQAIVITHSPGCPWLTNAALSRDPG